MAPPEAGPAGPQDGERLAGVLGRAFADDPFSCWLVPDAEERHRTTAASFVGTYRVLSRSQHVTTDAGRSAVAIWGEPGRWPPPADDLADLDQHRAAVHRPEAIARMDAALEVIDGELHPTEPHVYVAFLATDPPDQGRGLGRAVLGAALAASEASGVPAYLWTAKPANVGFYESCGFAVRWSWPIPDGPPTWGMWREPGERGARP